MDDCGRVRAVKTRQVGRRVHLRAHLVCVEKPTFSPACGVAQPVDLMGFGGDRQHAGALPLRVQPEALDIGLHTVEVLYAHLVERVDLVGPARFSVLGAVRQARVDEAAVAARRRPPDPVRLDQDDGAIGIAFGGVQCRPQPGVSAADDEQVAGDRLGQRRVIRPRDVQPHRAEGACRKRTFDQRGVDRGVEHRLHTAQTTGRTATAPKNQLPGQ